MNRKLQLSIAVIVVIMAVVLLVFISINGNNKTNRLNEKRTEYTTELKPDQMYADPYQLHLVFEKLSGFELEDVQKNKKITYYIYNFTNESENQYKDVFLSFCEKLKENGYEQVAATADGAGYINQYELLYDDMHYMVYTECAPDKVVLSVVDYNEDV